MRAAQATSASRSVCTPLVQHHMCRLYTLDSAEIAPKPCSPPCASQALAEQPRQGSQALRRLLQHPHPYPGHTLHDAGMRRALLSMSSSCSSAARLFNSVLPSGHAQQLWGLSTYPDGLPCCVKLPVAVALSQMQLYCSVTAEHPNAVHASGWPFMTCRTMSNCWSTVCILTSAACRPSTSAPLSTRWLSMCTMGWQPLCTRTSPRPSAGVFHPQVNVSWGLALERSAITN